MSRLAAALLLGSAMLWGADALGQSRQAVVIGNSSYEGAPLQNAVRDAVEVADSFRAIGFEVTERWDVGRDDLLDLMAEIDMAFDEAEIGIVYYAGHAVQVDGVNHLLPVDLARISLDEIERKQVPLQTFIGAVADESATGLRLVILDACRTDPFSPLGASIRRGLSLEQVGASETLIAYSTAPGSLASDGPRGGNGPYALAISRALHERGLEVAEVMRRVRGQVREATEGRQIPWTAGSVEERYWLNRAPAVAGVEAEEVEVDEVLAHFLADSVSAADLRRFLLFFPDSAFADEARARLADVAAQDRPVPAALSLEVPDQHATPETPSGLDAPIPGDLFRDFPETLPDAPGGLAEIVTASDRLASDFADLRRVAPGVRSGLMDLPRAAQACAYAVTAQPQNPRFAFQLGRVLETARLYPWARHFYRHAAERDYSAALVNLGHMHYAGDGVERDYATALRFYREAAALGNLRARTNIGTMYVRGLGVPERPDEGMLWYKLASESGWVNAQNAMADVLRRGTGGEQDFATAASLYRLAALNGQRAAMTNLARMLLDGRGVEQDRAEAHRWFERAVEAGDRYGPRFYALDLIAGGEARSDPGRIVDLLQTAANRNFPVALLDLAKIYEAGDLVGRDLEEALLFALRADAAGVNGAPEAVARISAALDPATVDAISDEARSILRFNGR